MSEQDDLLKDAEAFIRKALEHFPDAKADDDSIVTAAKKVAKSMDFVAERKREAA